MDPPAGEFVESKMDREILDAEVLLSWLAIISLGYVDTVGRLLANFKKESVRPNPSSTNGNEPSTDPSRPFTATTNNLDIHRIIEYIPAGSMIFKIVDLNNHTASKLNIRLFLWY
jgi:hypothetical protein